MRRSNPPETVILPSSLEPHLHGGKHPLLVMTSSPTVSPSVSKGLFTWNSSASQNREQVGALIASTYSYFLVAFLFLFTIYLLLPQGFRRHVFHSYPRRHMISSTNRDILALGLQSPRGIDIQRNKMSSTRLYDSSNSKGVQLNRRQDTGTRDAKLASSPSGNNATSFISPASETGTWGLRDISFGINQRRHESDSIYAFSPFRLNQDEEETIDFISESKAPSLVDIESLASYSSTNPSPLSNGHPSYQPSAHHPDKNCGHKVPSEMVISSTLASMREPGVRLYAHGTQCLPRRIWVQINVQQEMIEWRTEDPNKSANGARLGPKHVIPLQDILFVDVGKTTTALKRIPQQEFSSDVCFSILTRNGSLDLRTSNKLERDALVSCFCLILDTVYLSNPYGKHWRSLYDGVETSSSPNTKPIENSFGYETSGFGSESETFSGILDTSLLSI